VKVRAAAAAARLRDARTELDVKGGLERLGAGAVAAAGV
jgi:hypothetical protein